MILLVGGIKGGSGKSTVATNLAVMRTLSGKDVLLIDADDQETAYDFTMLRNDKTGGGAGYTCIKLTGKAVYTEGARLAKKYDDIIIDTGGRDTTSQRAAISIADVMIIPFMPRSFDIWTLERTTELVEEMQQANQSLKVYSFLNRTDSRGSDNQEAENYLKENNIISLVNTPLGNRKIFGNAAAQGLGVVEIKPTDEKATKEIKCLYKYLFNVDYIL
jgi:chromosome partitioning protein